MVPARAFAVAIAFAAASATTAVADDAAGSAPPAAPVNPAIQVSPGDSWTYEVRDEATGAVKWTVAVEVTKATDAVIETRIRKQDQGADAPTTSTEIFDARWRLKDNGKFAFQPYLDLSGVPDDLQLGKSWSFKDERTLKGSASTFEIAGVGIVEAWERVTLPNGATYDAFKIDFSVPKTPAPGHGESETHSMWFAPAVNRVVKRIDEAHDNGKLLVAVEQTLREYRPAPRN